MPYISLQNRASILRGLEDESFPALETGGELNWFISSVIANYIQDNGLSYSKISDVLAALEGAKFEFLRRVVGPYEDEKMGDNGDIPNYPEQR